MRNPSSVKLRSAAWIALIAIGTTLTVWGKDFWEEKPFTQWSEQEAMKILSESPWARTQTVMAGVLGGQQQSNSSRIKDIPRVQCSRNQQWSRFVADRRFFRRWRFGSSLCPMALIDSNSTGFGQAWSASAKCA